jgi:hypothetical protein
MTADTAPPETLASPDVVTPPANWARVFAPIVIDVVVPTALYYLLRHIGLGVIAPARCPGPYRWPGRPTPGAAPVDPICWRLRWSPR